MERNQLSIVQQEILKAIEQLSEKSTYTEAILAKKIRENTKLDSKKKAGIALQDLEKVMNFLSETNIVTFTLHLNSANDLLIKKSEELGFLNSDAKKRRQSSEKSMSVLTNADFDLKKNPHGKPKKKIRTERKSININSDFEE